MRFSKPTWTLAGTAALLALLLVADRGPDHDGEALPRLPPLNADEATRITFTRSGETTVITREDDVWRITRPLQAEADTAILGALLANFKNEIPMDLRVDRGNLDKYGADDNAGVTFEAFTSSSEPYISMVIGNDVTGGSTLVRLSGSDAVYRARIGGRFQYDRPTVDWRNHMILNVEAELMGAGFPEFHVKKELYWPKGKTVGMPEVAAASVG